MGNTTSGGAGTMPHTVTAAKQELDLLAVASSGKAAISVIAVVPVSRCPSAGYSAALPSLQRRHEQRSWRRQDSLL